MDTLYPLSALRVLALHCQHLAAPAGTKQAPGRDEFTALVQELGSVQIDTLQVVKRAHHVSLWARLGRFDTDAFDQLLYDPQQRCLYEGWAHAACILPLAHYRFHRWRIDRAFSFNPAFQAWLSSEANRTLAAQTLERIRAEGPLRVADFDAPGTPRGSWYDWKPSKMALEALFAHGELMVAERINFQRVYDLSERVLPDWVDRTPADPVEARRFCLEQAARALGVFEPRALAFYAYMRAAPARALVKEMIQVGTLVEIRGEGVGGSQNWLIHRDRFELLERAVAGEILAERTTFLAPFDSLFWAPDRDVKLWGFEQLLECYKPAGERRYGYFSFPILHRDRLVGRFDPKLEREAGILRIKQIHLEPGIELDEELLGGVRLAFQDFLAWHAASGLVVEASHPAEFGVRLLQE